MIKTFSCVICAATVTKPKSYAYKAGRACRSHQDAQTAHDVAETAKAEALKTAQTPKRMQNFNPLDIRHPDYYCWCCKKDGTPQHEVYQRLLINIAKAELQGHKFNPFDPNTPAYVMTRDELGVLIQRFAVDASYPDWKRKQILKGAGDKILLTRMSECIVLCTECASTYEFGPNPTNLTEENYVRLKAAGFFAQPIFDETSDHSEPK